MITCIVGTRAQLIKMAPVIKELEQKTNNFQILMTGQHKETMDILFKNFSIETKPKYFENPKEISSIIKMFFWFPRVLIKMLLKRKKLFEGKEPSWILVHGDTLSTLLGAFVGKFTTCKVAHIESGLRSNSLFSPFPEEITRILTFYLADIGFCPGQWAVDNLKKYSIQAINTGENTIIDSVRIALTHKSKETSIPKREYVVVSIHRFENIYKKERFNNILDIIYYISNKYYLLFVLHPTTKKRLERYAWMEKLKSNDNISLVPRMGYMPFVNLLSKASFVVTDGGSNQEELSYMNIPTLVMRDTTERPEGIGKTAVLNGFDRAVVDEFLSKIKTVSEKGKSELKTRPSKFISNYILDNNN